MGVIKNKSTYVKPGNNIQSLDDGESQGNTDNVGVLYEDPGSLAIVLGTMFVNAIEYSILMPTVWHYTQSLGGTKLYLGIVLAAFSLGRLLCLLPVGVWSDARSIKEVFLVTMTLQVIGNLLYGLAGHFKILGFILAGRALCGLGASNSSLSNIYISRSVAPKKQTMLFSIQSGIMLFGNVLGPALNLGLVHLDVKLGIFELNENTAAGYFMFFLNLIFMVLLAYRFRDPASQSLHSTGSSDEKKDEKWLSHLISSGSWWSVHVAFTNGFLVSSLETALTPISKDEYNFGSLQNSFMFAGIALVALISVVTTIKLDKHYSGRRISLIGISIMCISLVAIVAVSFRKYLPLWGLGGFGGSLFFGLAMTGNTAHSIYSILLKGKPKGFFLSFKMIIMSIGRVIGPLVAGIALHSGHHKFFFIIVAVIGMSLPFTLPCVWDKISSAELYHQEDSQTNETDEAQPLLSKEAE
eukprot:m.54720 g.54720  ORF g.54720 m.54720 type:complete len:468 (+) comp10945_c0_seq1:362-1765(+)